LAYKKWGVLVNVALFINSMRTYFIKRIYTIKELDQETELFQKTWKNGITSKKKTNNLYKVIADRALEELDFIKKQTEFFEEVATGENFDIIKKAINNDASKFVSTDKNEYFINKKNPDGLTALYLATVCGHLEIVKLLIENDGNQLIKCGDGEGESILDAAVRWDMMRLVDYFLYFLEWPKIYLENSYKLSRKLKKDTISTKIKDILRKHENKKSTCFCF